VISFGDPEARQMEEDSYGYRTLAENLIAGKGFQRLRPLGVDGADVWTPELLRTPGYPFIIATCEVTTGHGRAATVIAQQLLGVLLCAVVTLVCYGLIGRRAALVAGGLLAVDVQAVGLGTMLIPEAMFTLIVVCSTLLAARCARTKSMLVAGAAGACFGIAILVKPAGVALPIAVSVVLVVHGVVKRDARRVLVGLVISVCSYILVGAWIVRNGVVCGEYTFNSAPRYVLLMEHAAYPLARSEETPVEVARGQLASKLNISKHRIRYGALSPEEGRELQRLATQTILEHRWHYVSRGLLRTVNLLCGPEKNTLTSLGLPPFEFGVVKDRATPLKDVAVLSWLVLGVQVVFIVGIYALCLRTMWQVVRRKRRLSVLVWLCAVSAICVLLASSGFPGCPRYRSPVVPLLVIVGVASIGQHGRIEGDHDSRQNDL